jgi:hypothetical protein
MPRATATMSSPFLATLLGGLPLALAAVACNPYAPELGDIPFECGSGDPQCPDGYACAPSTTHPSGLCVKDPSPDASTAFICANDHTEPNDTPAAPFITTIPATAMDYELFGLSLCPAGELDHFRFGVVENGTNLEASIISVRDMARGTLQLTLLTSTGVTIATGVSDPVTPERVKLEVSNRLAAGDYILQVKSPNMTENNYDLSIKTCVDPLPCD